MALPPLLRDRLRLPAIGSPLFIISKPELVIAQCKAGMVGSFPSLNARPLAQFEEWLVRIREELAAHDRAHPEAPSAPFAVNLIVHKTNNRLEEDLALCVKHKVPLVITSLGARTEVNDAIHSYGGIVLHDVITNAFAKKAVEKGADGLIPVAAGAGGTPAPCRRSLWCRRSASGSTGRWPCRGPSPTAAPSSPPKPWARTSPIWARCSSPPKRPSLSRATRT